MRDFVMQPRQSSPYRGAWEPAGGAPQRSTVVRVPSASEALVGHAAQTLASGRRALREAPDAALRFAQFFKAYLRAISVGLGAYFLLSEIAIGHVNILKSLATHVFSVIAAPFYAVMLAPAIYGIYLQSALLPIAAPLRVYAIGGLVGTLSLVSTLTRGNLFDAGTQKSLVFSLVLLASGLLAARTFNAAVRKIKAAS